MKKNKRGVSLIVLVITIIVIIILAAAVILTINNNNPMDNANIARYTSDRANVQDALSAAIGKIAADKLCSITIPEQANIEQGIYYLSSDGSSGGKIGWNSAASDAPAGYDTSVILGMKMPTYSTSTKWGIDSAGNAVLTVGDTVYGPNQYVLGEGTKNKEEASWDHPYIPQDFHYLEGTVATGFVIRDVIGNEFVWVPVRDIAEYKRRILQNNIDDEYVSSSVQDNIPQAQRDAVSKYGGFYLGRYEASESSNGSAQVMKGKTPWRYVTALDAIAKSSAMYAGKTDITSVLMSSYMWDTTCYWFVKSGAMTFATINSNAWGNTIGNSQYDGSMKNTGFKEEWKCNNIYDMGGNLAEYTTEQDTKGYIARGPYAISTMTDFFVSARHISPTMEYNDNVRCFRVAIYIND